MTKLLTSDIYLAVWLHYQFAALRVWTLGPGWRFPPHASKAVEALTPALARVQEAVSQSDTEGVLEAPSAWHAALYCSSLQHLLSTQGQRVLFRGQANASWSLTPTLRRGGVDVDAEKERAEWFAEVLGSLSLNTITRMNPSSGSKYFRIGMSSYFAAAQHYGISTDLLDFTTDADVAVKFACMNESSSEPQSKASIFILHLDAIPRANLRFILPPPFIPRLYLQRGVFIESSGPLDRKALQIQEIRFPHPSEQEAAQFGRFEVRRNQGKIIDILPEETGLGPAIELANEIYCNANLIRSQDDLDDLVRNRIKPHYIKYLKDGGFGLWSTYVDHFEDMMYQLVYSINEEETMSVDPERFEFLVRSNPEICGSVAEMYGILEEEFASEYPPEQVAFLSRLAQTIREINLRNGYDHEAKRQYHYGHLMQRE